MAELTQEQRNKAQKALDDYNADLKARGIDAFEDEAQKKQKAWDNMADIHNAKNN